MGELETVEAESRELVHPATGELISLDDPRACAVAIVELRRLEHAMKDARAELVRVIAEEAERQGSKTLHLPGVTVTLKDSTRIEWDLDELEKLRDLGLPEDRYNALVRTEVTYKVQAGEAKRIAGANAEYAKVIERARHDFPGQPYVTAVEVES
jgi:hypothetical protein